MDTFHYQPDIPAPESKAVLRTAAYCRVSTLSEDQQSSFDTQCAYYKQMIESDPKKEFVGVYADQMSGLHADKRTEFMRLIQDCEDGNIDLVITRSVSRFSRNMGDCLHFVNKLRMLNIPVIFEKEHISSLDKNAELFLSILASMAQEEVGHLSRNIRWAHVHAAELGKPIRKAAYGYRQNKKREWIIYEPEAKRVRLAFRLAAELKSYTDIVDSLNALESLEKTGVRWSQARIYRMFRNEAYRGDVLTHKTYKPDYILAKQKKNNGEREQYYIEDHHQPIIPVEVFDQVQAIIDANLLNTLAYRMREKVEHQQWIDIEERLNRRGEQLAAEKDRKRKETQHEESCGILPCEHGQGDPTVEPGITNRIIQENHNGA